LNNALPAYHQIMQTIKGWVINKEFAPAEKIPSENELALRFKVSRMTVHQAIRELVREGFLTSRRGEGTFVTNNEEFINSFNLEFSGSIDELFFHQMLKTKMKSVTVQRSVPPRRVSEALGLRGNSEEVTQIKRVQLLGSNRLAYVVNYLPQEIGSKIVEQDLYEKPLLTILTKNLGIRFTEATQTIEASFADTEVAEKLEMAAGLPILFVERVMYTRGHKPVEVYQSSYRGDANRFIFRLKQVQRKSGKRWVHEAAE
jgi:GntR family transcriptional regulator